MNTLSGTNNRKNVIIFGDSYSTFDDFVPEGYAVYYHTTPRAETDVTKVTQTWWYPLCEELSLNLVRNDSWSGSPVSFTGWDLVDCSETSSFIRRLEKLTDEGFFEENKIDVVFAFGATNDSWCGAPLGELKLDNISREELYSVCPAVAYFIKKLSETFPSADVNYIMNTGLRDEISQAIRAACEKYGVRCIELHDIDKQCGHPTIAGMKSIKEQVKAAIL